jgi:5-methylcytosine-specific restriction endonuclease McrA
MNDPTVRAAVAERTRRQMADPEARLIGQKNPNWQGGTSLTTHRRVAKKRWLRFRTAFLKTRLPICSECGSPGRDLHHTIPVRVWPEGEFDEKNVVILCRPCHARAENALRLHS